MFKITQNSVQRFSLGEILLMIALNQVDAAANRTVKAAAVLSGI